MARSRHPNKDIEAAVKYAEERDWVCSTPASHAWGRLRCPHGRRGGCQMSVWSTPRNPTSHARRIRKFVDDCPHRDPEEETS